MEGSRHVRGQRRMGRIWGWGPGGARRRTHVGSLLACIAIIAGAQDLRADYRIRLQDAGDASMAASVVGQLSGLGYKGVRSDGRGVIAEGFKYYPDASLALGRLKREGFPAAEIVPAEAASAGTFRFPGGTRHRLAAGSSGALASEQELDASVRADIYGIVKNQDTATAIADLEFMLANRTKEDPASGVIALRLGYLNHRAGDVAKAEEYFASVATGKYAAPVDAQNDGIIRYGKILHSQKKKLEAWGVFREAIDTLPPGEQRAEAIRQASGEIMEFAKDRKMGTLADARRFFAEVLPLVAGDFPQHASTIRLMDAETYFYEGDYEAACVRLEAFLNDYPADSFARDHAMGLTFHGVALSKLGRHAEGRAELEKVLQIDSGKIVDGFAVAQDPQSHALGWLSKIAEREGLHAQAETYRTMKKDRERRTGGAQ